MAITKAYYNLFLRNWINRIATETDLNNAVDRGYLTKENIDSIIKNEQLNDSNKTTLR